MITNVADLPADLRLEVARKISDLSHQPNSSLLPKSTGDAMQIIASGIMLAKMNQHQPLFIVAFEPTGDQHFTEVGITCNLIPTKIRGRHAFPEIIDAYRGINGNGKNILYLTTTDIRMVHADWSFGKIQLGQPHEPCECQWWSGRGYFFHRPSWNFAAHPACQKKLVSSATDSKNIIAPDSPEIFSRNSVRIAPINPVTFSRKSCDKKGD